MVFISSGAGLGVSLTGIQAYASAKAALISLARQLAHELGPFGINVNAVAPGFLRTSPDYERQWASYGDEGQEAMLAQISASPHRPPRRYLERRSLPCIPLRKLDHRPGPCRSAEGPVFVSIDNTVLPTWTWPEERLQGLMNRARAGAQP